MDKFFFSMWIVFTFSSGIFSQDIFLCLNSSDTIWLDEQIFNDDWEKREKHTAAIIKKFGGANAHNFHFNTYKTDFSFLTKMSIGEILYLSTEDGVFGTKVTGYKIDMPVVGYEFYPILERPSSAVYLESHWDKNIYVCSKNSSISPIKYTTNNETLSENAIKKTLKSFQKKISIDNQSESGIYSEPEIRILSGNFLNSGEIEFAVSFVEQVSFEGFAGGIVIMNANGEIIKEMFELKPSDFYFNRIVGIIDVNGDGIEEILLENGYYEGHGYELWKYSAPSFLKIASGFYWGV